MTAAAVDIVLERSMNPGFPGIESELSYRENTVMLFGDARRSLAEVVRAIEQT